MLFFLTFVLCIQVITCKVTNDYTKNLRAKNALIMIKTKPCVELIGSENCTLIKSRLPHQMQFYMASSPERHLNVLKIKETPLEIKMDIKRLNAVVVIDPFPEAHFGHTTIVMPILKISAEDCKNRKGRSYVVGSTTECMFLPRYKFCDLLNQLKKPDEKPYICNFHSIPKVTDTTAPEKNQLFCHPDIESFGACPIVKTKKNNLCDNKRRCTSHKINHEKNCRKSCDHAVLISGGWNKYTNKIRHLENLHDMYGYLRKKEFPQKYIKIFFANNSTIDLDDNAKTEDTNTATESSTIINHITSVCKQRQACIDTFVLYLNGPTLPNGNILLWDKNKDGRASDSEIIQVKQLIDPLKSCHAKNILIIADQNFAGQIIAEVKSKLGYDDIKRVHVITASSKHSYSYGRDFTKTFVSYDAENTATNPTRKISAIYKHMKQNLSNKYKIKYLPGLNADLTVTGDYGQPSGCRTNTDGLGPGWTQKSRKRQKRSTQIRSLDDEMREVKRQLFSHGS